MSFLQNNAGAIIGTGSSIIGTMMTNYANKKAQAREMDFARESYQTQRNDVLADRDHEEAYNSPLAQAQRLRNAGMSPMDYMSEPVATSTGDSGSINQPAEYRAENPLANMAALGAQADQRNLAEAQLQEQKRVDDSIIAKNEAETAKTSGDNYRAGQSLKMEGERLDMEKQRFTDEIRKLRLSNAQQDQINKHNDVMFPLIERAQKVETELAEETKSLMVKKLKAEISLDHQKIRLMEQEYITNGPTAFTSQLTEEMYGIYTDEVRRTIMDQMHCDANEASIAMIRSGIQEGVFKGSYGQVIKDIAIGRNVIADTKPDSGDNGAMRGVFGSLIRAIAFKKP